MVDLLYRTRDAKGNDIEKKIKIKEYEAEDIDFTCPLCLMEFNRGISIKKIVSSNFTDWAYVGDYICSKCSGYFSLFPYSYIINKAGIRLFNIREMAEEIKRIQDVPFKTIITISGKKHLFYKANENWCSELFTVNLEEEQIAVDINELRELFLFVESLLVLGENKKRLGNSGINHEILRVIGFQAKKYLDEKLRNRQIMIPLYLAQKPDLEKEEAICNLDLILKTYGMQKPL